MTLIVSVSCSHSLIFMIPSPTSENEFGFVKASTMRELVSLNKNASVHGK